MRKLSNHESHTVPTHVYDYSYKEGYRTIERDPTDLFFSQLRDILQNAFTNQLIDQGEF